ASQRPPGGCRARPAAGPTLASSHSTTASAAPHHLPGRIAIFPGRKSAKLYARQDFAPLFDAPVTITPSDRPLGTHIFTAEADKSDANALHWSVISLPQRNVTRHEDEHGSRPHKAPSGAQAPPERANPAGATAPYHHPRRRHDAHH